MKLPILKAEKLDREFYKALLASIGEGMIAVDMEGVILSVNRAFEKMLGWKQDEVVGKRLVR